MQRHKKFTVLSPSTTHRIILDLPFVAIMHQAKLDQVDVPSSGTNFAPGTRIQVPMATEKPETVVRIENMSADNLESIKRSDVFLYYSIPEVRRSAVLMVNTQAAPSFACPTNPLAAQDADSNQPQMKVTRCTRLSFECHPDLLLRDELEYTENFDLSGCEGLYDPFLRLFG